MYQTLAASFGVAKSRNMHGLPNRPSIAAMDKWAKGGSSAGSTSTTYNVVDLGAKADGKTDSRAAFLSAWSSACASNAAATVLVPSGSYLLTRVVFSGQCKNSVTFQIDGTLVAPTDYGTENWITFDGVSGVTILGGTLDGQGAGLWACKNAGKTCPIGATSLEFTNSREVLISGLTSLNSQMFHIDIHDCENVNIQGVHVTASGDSPNTDGIHVAGSTGVNITRAIIKTGDDCISIGPGATNLWIENIGCGPGHGISIGKWSRIKTWAKPNQGFVRGVLFEDVTINNAQNPVIIDQEYCPDNNCPSQPSGVKISNVTYRNITGSSATEKAVNFDCSHTNPCTGIVLDIVDLTYGSKPATASCTNAAGSATGVVHPPSCLAS
ncbi:hypothetical protein Scep_029265 [Stephania cephalantha]|uniref:Polygalacturonase n=1 Tax=Stephania cephalantha TaxID=152367 RepID=A0AAP0E4Z2_9MAGN